MIAQSIIVIVAMLIGFGMGRSTSDRPEEQS